MAALLSAEAIIVLRPPVGHELDTDFMFALPDHPALPARLRPSCQMEHEALREVINVANGQARTYLTEVDQRAPFKKVIRRSLNPIRLIEGSPKEPTPIQKMCAHLVSASATSGCPGSQLDGLSNEPGKSTLSEVSKRKCQRR
jgi:hypothetical protein